MAPSQKTARSTFSLNNFGKRWSFPVKRPRTKWRKPRANFVELVHILKDSSSSSNSTVEFPVRRFLDTTRKRESLEAEVIQFLPSYLCEEHFSWSVASTFSSSVKPSSGQISFRRSSSEATIAVYSPTSCSEENFSSDDVMSFVVSNDCCDVESFLARMPCYNEKDNTKTVMGEEPNACSMSASSERGHFGTVSAEQSKEVTSMELGEEDYRIDVSDFEPDEVVLETDSKSEEKLKRGLCLRLDYEAVMTAWSHGGCLWADGRRPEKMQVHVEHDACAASWATLVL